MTKQQTLTEAFAELDQITKEFEEEEVDLEKGIERFKRGLELAQDLKKRLAELENKIEEVKAGFDKS